MLLPMAGGFARQAFGAQAPAGKAKPASAAAQPKPAAAAQPAPGTAKGAPPEQAPGQGGVLAPSPDTGDIDEILQGEEEVLSGNGFSYDPGNRRDPFKSLLAGPERTEIRGPRPEGIPGLLIDEIDLKGIWRTGKGFVAQVMATNQKKTYLLKAGDQLYDGDVVSISHAEVVFKQIVQDPTALKPFREVVKSLNPSS
jgi:Tfp pilus assembly protein PilP